MEPLLVGLPNEMVYNLHEVWVRMLLEELLVLNISLLDLQIVEVIDLICLILGQKWEYDM